MQGLCALPTERIPQDPPSGFVPAALLADNGAERDVDQGGQVKGKGEGGLANGRMKVQVGAKEVAVFSLGGGQVFACDAVCPHQGGKLELGDVEECAGGKHRVLCPRHGWAFDLRSGYSEDACDYAIHAYATKVLPGGVVCVSEKPLPQPSIE